MASASSSLYATLGDVFHFLVLTNTATYAYLVVKYAHPETVTEWFDEEWFRHGFCVTNLDVPYWNSHDMCLYADTAFAAIIVVMYLALKSGKGVQRINDIFIWSAVSILTHGLVHGFIAYQMRTAAHDISPGGTRWERMVEAGHPWVELFKLSPMALLFWFPLIKSGSKPGVSNWLILILSVTVILGSLHIQEQFGFTYVQTVITLVFGISELLFTPAEGKLDFTYAALAFAGIPIGAVPWFEAMACTRGFRALGGHVLFDVSIPLTLLTTYVACYLHGEVTYQTKVNPTRKKVE